MDSDAPNTNLAFENVVPAEPTILWRVVTMRKLKLSAEHRVRYSNWFDSEEAMWKHVDWIRRDPARGQIVSIAKYFPATGKIIEE